MPPVALLYLGWFPRSIKVMQGYQPFLNVGAGAHFLGGTD
jgi:hypothetical protein